MISGSSDSESISPPQLWFKMVKGTKSGKPGEQGKPSKAYHNLRRKLGEQGMKVEQTGEGLKRANEELKRVKEEPTSARQPANQPASHWESSWNPGIWPKSGLIRAVC